MRCSTRRKLDVCPILYVLDTQADPGCGAHPTQKLNSCLLSSLAGGPEFLRSLLPASPPGHCRLAPGVLHASVVAYVLPTESLSFQGVAISLAYTKDVRARSLPLFVAGSLDPTTIDQVLVIAHFLNSAVRVVIASGWNANPQLAKVSGERGDRERPGDIP